MSLGLGLIPFLKEIDILRRAYRNYSDRIVREMLSLDLVNWSELKSIKMRKDVNGILKEMNGYAVKWSKVNVQKSYDRGVGFAERWLKQYGLEEDPLLKDIHEDGAEGEIRRVSKYLIEANSGVRQSVEKWIYLTREISKSLNQVQEFAGGLLSPEEEEEIRQEIMVASQVGASRGTMKNQIRARIAERIVDGNLIDINGRMWRIDKYSEMVARTELRRTQSEGVINESKRYGSDLVEVSNHGCDCPEICLEFEGNVYSISGRDSRYPLLSDSPPYHPNCMHFIIPYVEN